MKYNLINMFDERLNKLYNEVVSLLSNMVRTGLDYEASQNGMMADNLEPIMRFRFLDNPSLDNTKALQNSFIFLSQAYNVDIVMVYKGQYYIPEMTIALQYRMCWDYVITPGLLPIFVETDDTAGLTVNDLPSHSWTVNRRDFDDYDENDGLGETLRVDLPKMIFPNLVINPMFLNPELAAPIDAYKTMQFDADLVHIDFNRSLGPVEDAARFLYCKEYFEGLAFYTLAQHALRRPNAQMDYVCWRLEQSAECGNIDAASSLFQYYYYGLDEVEKDYAKAVKYAQQIAATGDPKLSGFNTIIAN